MSLRLRSGFCLLAAILLLWMAGGCQTTSPAVKFYALEAVAAGPDAPGEPAPTAPAIGVETVTLPEYLARPQMVSRTRPNRVGIDEYHRWAGPLNDEIQRVLIENLIVLTGAQRISRPPWRGGFQPDVRVRLDVYRFEAAGGDKVHLLAAVTLVDRRGGRPASTWTVNLEEKAAGEGYADLVAAQSRLLATLSRGIARRIAPHTARP